MFMFCFFFNSVSLRSFIVITIIKMGGGEETAALVGVLVERGVATITLQRPARANALVPAMIDQLRAALDRLEADGSVRVVVLTGAGRFFCSGLDLGGAAARPG